MTALDDRDPLLSDLGRERTVGRNIKALSARYRLAAFRCLAVDGVMTRHSVASLQALVLLAYARVQRGLSCWTLLGLIHNAAVSLGCHIDPDNFPLSSIEREERRRVWLGLMVLIMIQNSLYSYSMQQPISLDVKLPASTDSTDLAQEPLEPQHAANFRILDCHILQIFLLLLRPAFCRLLRGEGTEETHAARSECLGFARESLANFKLLREDLQFTPYRWYTAGLGSLHAFHAAVVLAVGLFDARDGSEFDEMTALITRTVGVFATLSERSFFCGKAVPVLRRIMCVLCNQVRRICALIRDPS